MKIKSFDTSKKALIIAEIGNNHEGDYDIAVKLVEEAAEAGVDAVKFQTFNANHYVSRKDSVRFERLKQFELTHTEFENLADLTRKMGMLFISTPFDVASAKFLSTIVDAFKISSGDINHFALINSVSQYDIPVILSTGASTIDDIQAAITVLSKNKSSAFLENELSILHCVSSYPTPIDQTNLRVLHALKQRFNSSIGYSDHTLGIDASVLAVGLGAEIIEKHFTLDHHYSEFRDHELSADPQEMKTLVEKIRNVELMLGSSDKRVQESEINSLPAMRRSIAVNGDFEKGFQLTEDSFTWIRPGTGVAPGNEDKFIGKRLTRSLEFGEILSLSDVE